VIFTSVKKKIVFQLEVIPSGYPEHRLKEIINWILSKSNKVPLEAKTKIRMFYSYFVDFMKWDQIDMRYGITFCFVDEEIHFTREVTGELWGIVKETTVL